MRKKMKKTIIVLTLLLLLLAASGMAESVLPDGISSALEADGIGADRVMAVLPRIGDGPVFSFVAVQDQRGKNVLYGFSEEASGWKRILKTEAALQQECPVMLLDRSGTEYDGMNLGIAFSCAENRPSSAETVWEWNPKTGQWMLQAYLRHDSTFDIWETNAALYHTKTSVNRRTFLQGGERKTVRKTKNDSEGTSLPTDCLPKKGWRTEGK